MLYEFIIIICVVVFGASILRMLRSAWRSLRANDKMGSFLQVSIGSASVASLLLIMWDVMFRPGFPYEILTVAILTAFVSQIVSEIGMTKA